MEHIGTIRTPFTILADMPIQPKGAAEVEGQIILEKRFEKGLQDLDGFSHIFLLYQFHKADRTELTVVPFLDTEARGVFSTRSPLRPNHIGISIVEIVTIEANIVHVRGIDVLDRTPLLDIKPYIEKFDQVERSRSGWMRASAEEVRGKRSDKRFT
ncbi:MAG: tRNA (N6-threonylcarbamoyladenosine(37)-N6)-methyltransferase TrmO [Desulfopila sp.]